MANNPQTPDLTITPVRRRLVFMSPDNLDTILSNQTAHTPMPDPQSPWQRGSSENTKGLLRQYFPKGTDLSSFSQDDLDQVALKLNTRPRKTLGYTTPSDRFDSALALTG